MKGKVEIRLLVEEPKPVKIIKIWNYHCFILRDLLCWGLIHLKEFYYMDHAYFYPTRDYMPGKYGQLYRVVKNQLQLNKIVELTNKDKKKV